MKTQAWAWLAAAVLAAGLNSSYHNGGLEWAHRIAAQAGHHTAAVLALATGRADVFLAEVQMIHARRTPACPLARTLATLRLSMQPMRLEQARFEEMTARREQQLARFEANRARMEAQLARVRVASFNPIMIRAPKIACPRVQVHVPSMPVIKMLPIPVVHLDYDGLGPV